MSMKGTGARIRTLILGCFLAFSLHAGNPVPVPAGALLRGDLLDIHAPHSEGWSLMGSDRNKVEFCRRDPANGDTYVAVIVSFPIKGNPSGSEFLALVQAGIDKDANPRHFKNLKATLKPGERRSYKCLRYESSAEDKGVRGGASGVPYFLHIRALYCQHPVKPELGFMISYSQRGGPVSPSLDKDADSFFDGVQVPNPQGPRG